MSIKKVIAEIKKHKRFLITAHTNLEGDALGSELSFFRLLKAMGKFAVIVNEDKAPDGYSALPGVNNIKNLGKDFKYLDFDCFVALDCSNLSRSGQVSKINLKNKTVINIDHHISNDKFGDINWIDPYASSVSEMIYRLYRKINIPFDRETAELLYAGILTDTGSFRHSNTTSFTHQAVSELMKYGIDIKQIYKDIYENVPFQDIKLLAEVLPQIKRSALGKIVWFQIKQGKLQSKKISFDLTEHVLSFAREVRGVEVVALFKENLGVKDEIRVNLRSQGKIDVNKIASFFGGGGHKTASGCTINGKIAAVRKKVLKKIRESLNADYIRD